MGKKTAKNKNLGRSLIKDRFSRGGRTVGEGSLLHTTEVQDGYDWGRLNLQSVTEESSFQEFLRTAELAGTEFQAEKLNIAFVNPKSNVGVLSADERKQVARRHAENKQFLKIPRRPKWTESTTAEELAENENSNFLEWRRQLALLQEDENLIMTPYEKNLQFWRQLWRVIERSDVLVQIVDARNPLLFRNEDLEAYVKEVDPNKMNLILLNKADFLTDKQRQIWAEYFESVGIGIVFYSALLAQQKIKDDLKVLHEEEEREDEINEEDDDVSENDVDDESSPKINPSEAKQPLQSKTESQHEQQQQKQQQKLNENETACKLKTNIDILDRVELIEFFKNIYKGPKHTAGLVTIGLVGYPNVGKSSTINTLMIDKKVSVSATPGKTKHFQTLFVDKELMLCDSPGLVMPSFVSTKAAMILNGILPIDQMRDFVPSVNILCTEIPRHILEDKYGIMIARPQEGEQQDRPPYAEELLLAYGYNRGFMTSNGQPDQPRSARYVLKDYVNGKLLYCHAPPTIKQEEFHIFSDRVRPIISEDKLPKDQQRAMRINHIAKTSDLDQTFFKAPHLNAYIKGKSNFPHIRTATKPVAGGSGSGEMETVIVEKPWRHQKKEKREKLRRKFAHLDLH